MAIDIVSDPRYQRFRERYYDNFYRYVMEICDVTPTWQQVEFCKACQVPGARVAVASGHGCFGKGMQVLMYDGTVKKVEDVIVGDVLMGDDSTPRNVLSLCRGQENLYRVTFFDGTEHVYNESHILCLVATQTHGKQMTGQKEEVVLRDFLKWSDRKKRTHAAYRSSCDFNASTQSLLIPPYILGLWLGDGTRRLPQITKPDIEIKNAIYEYARSCGYGVREIIGGSYFFTNNGVKKGSFNDKLRQLGIWEKKRIPFCYLTSSKKDRLELLAAIIDTDGTLDHRARRVITVVQKNEDLANDIVFLTKSLGIHATKRLIQKKCYNTGKVGTYFSISITRNIEIIPIRIPRKKPSSDGFNQRSNLHFGIKKVDCLGVGNYYGFEIDGNKRFLSSDFMVCNHSGRLNL